MRTRILITVFIFICFILVSCEKTYEEGPSVSFRSEMQRITGKWRLVSMEGVDRLNPEIEQYMELTKDKLSDGTYKAYFTNFQWCLCKDSTLSSDPVVQTLYTSEGSWKFTFGSFGNGGYHSTERLEDNEGLDITIEAIQNIYHRLPWKILRLTNKELIIYYSFYWQEYCSQGINQNNITLTFEKV